ncbi:hypothetical protein IGI04_036375, partial [Brassica rapa subsp. trilocularis]
MTRIEFTTACQDAPGVLSFNFGQPRGRPYLRFWPTSYAYDPTKTEVLGMDERITTESAGT